MCRGKRATKGSLLHFVAVFAAIFISAAVGGKAFAATTNGIITASDGVRWEYVLEDSRLSIKFYDKPASLTTVTVPSLSDLTSLVPGAPNDLDTYFLSSADVADQDTKYGSTYPRREATAETTKLNMANTSKIQITGVVPIIDPAVETELVFGSNMVITNKTGFKIWVPACDAKPDGVNYVYCPSGGNGRWIEGIEEKIPNWNAMTEAEKAAFTLTREEALEITGCTIVTANFFPGTYNEDSCMILNNDSREFQYAVATNAGAAFGGYKLKLTNFIPENFNYIGWYAFKESTFNESNTTIELKGTAFQGDYIFENTNIKNVTISTNTYGDGLFKNCKLITNFSVADDVDFIHAKTFAGTGITSLDFSNKHIKRIGNNAFEGAPITTVNLTGVERLDYRAFKSTDIRELTLPKSINYLQAEVFKDNINMKKLTVAYDTMTSGTTHAINIVLENIWDSPSATNTVTAIEELTVLAPYAADEEVSATHLTMDEYAYHYDQNQNYSEDEIMRASCAVGYVSSNGNYWGYKYGTAGVNCGKQATETEKRWAKLDEKKNIVAPLYFANLHGLKKITVGDGIEYIGGSAFLDTAKADWSDPGNKTSGILNRCRKTDIDCSATESRHIDTINLPESLKGVGTLAFGASWSPNLQMTIPKNIEFIGQGAFRQMYNLKTDVDFPNLVFLGDDSFAGTMVKNIYLYDRLEYMGWAVFHGCFFINDITFDLDIFDRSNLIIWPKTLTYEEEPDVWYNMWGSYWTMAADNGYGSQINGMFGEKVAGSMPDKESSEYWGIRREDNSDVAYYHQKFGTITFTEKATTEILIPTSTSYGNTYAIVDPNNPYLSVSGYTAFFAYVNADKVDLSATPWKTIHPMEFHHTTITELLLPKNLETIGTMAFSQAYIKNELVLPDTLKMIGDGAFNCGQYNYNDSYAASYSNYHTPIIKKLPASLEFIGHQAFWGDTNLTADLNSPNLRRVYSQAFQRTHLRDVYIPETVEWLAGGTFNDIPTLRNITIDADYAKLVSTPETEPDTYTHYPQSLIDYSGVLDVHWVVDDALYNYHPYTNRNYATFYTIFNQTMKHDDQYVGGDGSIRCYNSNGCNPYAQIEADEHYGTLTFTDKNVTEMNISFGAFAGLSFEKVDMGATNWKSIGTQSSAFYKSKIGTLILPHALETIPYATFEYAEISEPFTIPDTVKTIDTSAFQWAKLKGMDMGDGVETINTSGFYMAEIEDEFALPESLKSVGQSGFMRAKMQISNSLPGKLETLGGAAFYDTDFSDNLIVPGSLKSIGWSALSTGDADVHYDMITVEPDITASMASGQLIHQMFWNVDVDKMVIKSNTLAGYDMPEKTSNSNGTFSYYEEFWHMPFEEIEITNLPKIGYAAFNGCDNLEKVDLGKDANLRIIRDRAFENAEKLDTILFSPSIKEETVAVGKKAFSNTGFKTIGKAGSGFNLYAAHFDAAEEVFSNMKQLTKVDVPATFSNGTIPQHTFYNDAELEEASVAYKVKLIDEGAFAKDNKLARIFIWGNTTVKDLNLPGYVAPAVAGMGQVDETEEDYTDAGPTIPEKTDIYAYSTWNAEPYAKATARESFEGDFYPLDEVLYLTTNKTHVKVNDDETDFDKAGLIVYGLRRDGVVLESDSWAEYDGNAYPRSQKDLNFTKMLPTIVSNPEFGTVWDTPVPVNELDIAGNENFANIDFELVNNDEGVIGVRLINIIYTDAYTNGKPDTDVLPLTDGDPEIPLPITIDNIMKAVAVFSGIAIAGTAALIASRRMFRRR